MKFIKVKSKPILVFIVFVFIVFVVFNNIKVDKTHSLSVSKFKEMISQKKRTLIFVWTDWCPTSKKVLADVWLNLQDSLSANGLDSVGIIVFTPERKSFEIISMHREKGLSNSFTISTSYFNSGFTDRIAIKKFLKEALGDSLVNRLTYKNVLFGLPLEFIVNNNSELESEYIPRSETEIVKYLKTIENSQLKYSN